MELFLYNTLNLKKEKFDPIKAGEVGIYTCGPTVYNYAHLGNLRTFLFQDFLVRTLAYNHYSVKRVMNITDVGHLSGDGDMGEDKMEKGSAREGRSAWDVAAYYTDAFKEDMGLLNMITPDIYCRATDNITEQIELVKQLEEKGFTYKTSDGIYFDTSKFPDYNRLSHLPLEELKEGARVEKNPEKKNPTDFSLWKFSPADAKRQMEWESPWGVGFPGWHLECSAMSLKFLGGQRDIHCGGIDHINVHHTNEIAQSEAATGEKFFNYWLHGAFLNIAGGKKMAKSENNYLTVANALVKKDINPLAFRYAALQVHYRKPMDYSENSLRQAEQGLNSLYRQIAALGSDIGEGGNGAKDEFLAAINDDLNMPQALAILFKILKSEMPLPAKLGAALDFDRVLGLNLASAISRFEETAQKLELPEDVKSLLAARQKARQEKDWEKADTLRAEITKLGYTLTDGPEGQQVELENK
ncbi:cysteine--tRNA ligase [Candidatus Falkowbacteria bacterium HGW-Falkowbacteria-2]|uniref:Cysteine--tRNA ligase n=1 Tax=Candidatus Falkowbacteria bacterium HGW-Falkowbacteria-2 TaxID=2013769 RepID=A0A2N2DY24_9BACT|nr:MAG: cysteine--tRNA ligase [Candidatus Falkowbacteria bacterium HGW-Falkowbacteria-2]